jgi:CrcB protein
MNQILAIAAGGAVGSVLRFGMSTWVHYFVGRSFPYGTLIVNVIGSLAMGTLYVLFLERLSSDPIVRAGVLVGLLGGFTTFSTFSMETVALMEQGAWIKSIMNILGSLVLCITATWAGVLLGRQL